MEGNGQLVVCNSGCEVVNDVIAGKEGGGGHCGDEGRYRGFGLGEGQRLIISHKTHHLVIHFLAVEATARDGPHGAARRSQPYPVPKMAE